ncbi:acyl-CoA dehydrogenase family protein [Nocardioides sp.]|uniref:acyl-CoA dehydrogenase family protein n=1 Tax=Nocardioides sp. TaxID=35761 RepID=UPI0025CE6A8D|nr:acyl-CoA dehydrogenase family protein [Nocardioides sp.]
MRFALDEDQQELARTVRQVLDRRGEIAPPGPTEPYLHDGGLWTQLCEQVGVCALAVPEEYDGVGTSSFETHVVLEVLGGPLTPSPLLSTGVLTVQGLLAAVAHPGSAGEAASDAAARILPAVAAGTASGTVVWAGLSNAGTDEAGALTATRAEEWTLTGRVDLVLGSHTDVLLAVAATPEGPALFEVTGEVAWQPTTALDQSVEVAAVELHATTATLLSDDPRAVRRLRMHATTAVTALQVGGARAALGRTVDFLRQREQFGRPLGSFQALKHRVADLLVLVEAGRSASWSAAWAVAREAADAERQTAVAKAWCSEAFTAVAGEMIQLHGGIAITWEHEAHRYFKRAHLTGQLLGTAREHRRTLLDRRSA